MLTLADVLVDQVHTLAPILAGVTVALVQLVLTAVTRVARIAVTRVAGDAVHAGAVVARVGLAVVGVALAQCALVPLGKRQQELEQASWGFFASHSSSFRQFFVFKSACHLSSSKPLLPFPLSHSLLSISTSLFIPLYFLPLFPTLSLSMKASTVWSSGPHGFHADGGVCETEQC